MANISFGVITVAVPGTPQRLTATKTDVHSILIEVRTENTGIIWIGSVGLVGSTRTNVWAYLGTPTTTIKPVFSQTIVVAQNPLDASTFYIDADVATDGVIASAYQL